MLNSNQACDVIFKIEHLQKLSANRLKNLNSLVNDFKIVLKQVVAKWAVKLLILKQTLISMLPLVVIVL